MCEKVLDMLGQAWNYLAMADISLNIVHKALGKWTVEPDLGWGNLPLPPIHNCRDGYTSCGTQD